MGREPAKHLLEVGLRLFAVIFVSYGASAGLVVAGGVVLHRAGMASGEAYVLAAMLGFLAWLGFGLWSAADKHLGRVYAVLILCLMSGVIASVSA